MEHGGAGDLIAEVRSAQQLWPDARFQSIEEAKLLKAAITPKLRSKLTDAQKAEMDKQQAAEKPDCQQPQHSKIDLAAYLESALSG